MLNLVNLVLIIPVPIPVPIYCVCLIIKRFILDLSNAISNINIFILHMNNILDIIKDYYDNFNYYDHSDDDIIQQHVVSTKRKYTEKRGPKVCQEFEIEVLKECYQHEMTINRNKKKCTNHNRFSHKFIKECARDVRNREYWDEMNNCYVKKWHLEKSTRDLLFSNKWVTGVLQRESIRHSIGSSDLSAGK